MIATLIQKIFQQLLMLIVVVLVLLAAYVSAGRQFMPVISRYSDFLENQILEATGIPVRVDSLTGNFSGFNPVIQINGLSIAVYDKHDDEEESEENEAPENALDFSSARIVVDIARSIWQRRWVLEEFIVESLELDLEQSANGAWQLSGVSMQGDAPLDLNSLYQTFLGFTHIDLRNVVINVRTRVGERISFTDGLVTFQNRGQNHYLHINAALENNPQQLAISLEVQGEQLSELAGELHVHIPNADYSELFSSQDFGPVSVQQVFAGGDFWLNLANGDIDSATAQWEVDNVRLSLDAGEAFALHRLTGKTTVSRGLAQDHWEIALADMAVNHGDEFWREFNAFVYLQPEQFLRLRVDKLDLGLLADLALSSDLLDAAAREQLLAYNPDGELRNLSLTVPLAEGAADPVALRTNLGDVEVGSVRGSPNMWGINGYTELFYHRLAHSVTGLAEIDSENFSMNIPNTFTGVWDYHYVNGRIEVDVDLNAGERVELLSSVIVAESEAVDGSAVFRSRVHRLPNGERTAELDLMVGATRIEAAKKSLYLPDGPNVSPGLRSSMEFLENGLIGGDITNSGLIFRGSTLADSLPITKTFQSFWSLENGEFNFSDQWPDLKRLNALVLTDDNNIDVDARSGESLDLAMASATGRVRRDENGLNTVLVSGQVAGQTSEGLAYFQATPLDAALKETLSTWQAEGDFSAAIEVSIPLDQPGTEPDVRLEMDLAENHLLIPDYDLDVTSLTGPVIFDTRTGLEPSRLEGIAFGDTVEISLSSEMLENTLQTIFIAANGRTSPREMIAWPRQSTFVRDLLAHMDGSFDYQAQMILPQAPAVETSNRLLVDTNLRGAELALPAPFRKSEDQELALHVELDFAEGEQQVTGNLGPEMHFDLKVENDVINSGLVLLGSETPPADLLSDSESTGLIVSGEMARFELQPWANLIASMGAVGESTSNLGNNIAFIDINTEIFSLYDVDLPEVNFRIEPRVAVEGWLTRLSSESVQGEVVMPFDTEHYLKVDLAYLRLPGEEGVEALIDPEIALAQTPTTPAVADGDNGAEEELEKQREEEQDKEKRVDPLSQLDPRDLPPMQFATNEFTIGERQYGSWEFTLIPTGVGAEFYDINFDFRGLRLGRDELDETFASLEPHFSWYYDNEQHSSELTGVLVADDLGAVLAANGYAPSMASKRAVFVAEVQWPGSPAFFAGANLSGSLDLLVEEGRFNRNSSGQGALRLVSFINLTAIFQRLRFSDDLLRRGLAYDEISGRFTLDNGTMTIDDRLVISGPSSLYQITGEVDLASETVEGEMFVTLPVSNNLPWIGLLTANIPLAVGAYLFDQIFGDQVDSLSSAVYTLSGPFEDLEPQFKQAFGSPGSPEETRQAQSAQ